MEGGVREGMGNVTIKVIKKENKVNLFIEMNKFSNKK